jgi:hypothetical protein
VVPVELADRGLVVGVGHILLFINSVVAIIRSLDAPVEAVDQEQILHQPRAVVIMETVTVILQDLVRTTMTLREEPVQKETVRHTGQ